MNAIQLHAAGRSYALYARPRDRLIEIVTQKPRHRQVDALRPTDLVVPRNQVLGIIGNNGAGKSTLLKLIARTLSPSTGRVEVNGSVGALLELGGGFHPDMTGRENVLLKAAILGLGGDELRRRYREIEEFAGIGDFMEQPVKTYSSGMFMRLAFAVATCVEPDILLIDEALSVGDGAFARKSFDRIMHFKSTGRTILFCSHSLYQVEAICDRVIWIDRGLVRMDGDPAEVIAVYNSFLNADVLNPEGSGKPTGAPNGGVAAGDLVEPVPLGSGLARFHRVTVRAGEGEAGRHVTLRSRKSDLYVELTFVSDPSMATPTVAVAVTQMDGHIVCSAGTHNDGYPLERDSEGRCRVTLCFPNMPLLKGTYGVDAYLLCELGIHCYEQATLVAELNVAQEGLEQGVVSLPHSWDQPADFRVKHASA